MSSHYHTISLSYRLPTNRASILGEVIMCIRFIECNMEWRTIEDETRNKTNGTKTKNQLRMELNSTDDTKEHHTNLPRYNYSR